MEHTLSVLLYSKYSPLSKQLMGGLKTIPPEYRDTLKLHNVCIDHKTIRDQIIKSKNLEVSVVPCVLVVHSTGTVEKYEGGNAFQWIEGEMGKLAQLYNQHNQPSSSHSQQPSSSHSQQPSSSHSQQPSSSHSQQPSSSSHSHHSSSSHSQKPSSSDDDISSDDEEFNSPPQRASKSKRIRKKTSLNNNDDLEPTINKPPISVRDGPGSFDITNEFGEEEEENREKPQVVERGATLMAAAMAMQKEREGVDKSVNPPGMG